MEYLAEYALFLAKAVTIVAALVVITGIAITFASRHKRSASGHLEVINLNRKYDEMSHTLADSLLSGEELKQKHKQEKRRRREERKKEKMELKKGRSGAQRKHLFVLEFEGDIHASAVTHLREEISAILTLAAPGDEVLLRLESSGGVVHGYGLAASQLQRIREHDIALTVAVDKVAASGGYLMACVADRLIAAPFSIIGSVGVVTQMPNFNRLLKKHDVDFEQLYAGEYKRTLTLFGENTEKGREKMQQELEEVHRLFKEFIRQQRSKLDVDRIATGEHWMGTRALELGLIDELCTSDDYLMRARDSATIVAVSYVAKEGLKEKLASLMRSRAAGFLGARRPMLP